MSKENIGGWNSWIHHLDSGGHAYGFGKGDGLG